MNNSEIGFSVDVSATKGTCPIGEKIGKQNITNRKIPVLSCEGACIRGEIARLAANFVAKEDAYSRGCHGELFTVPHSAISEWTLTADKVIVIDGCFLKCHGRIIENLIGEDRMRIFDALSRYKKYTDLFEIDDVPESKRKEAAQDIANWVLTSLKGEN